MKILKVKKIEGCLEGTNVRDILFDNIIDKPFVDYLAVNGKLIYNETSGKPFFRIIIKSKYIYTVKGSVGNKSCRLLLPDLNQDEITHELSLYIGSYKKNH
jgi:hypothetical protein